jgi:hypothetical protein
MYTLKTTPFNSNEHNKIMNTIGKNIYYCDTTNERVKIYKVFSSGLCMVKNKQNFCYMVLIGELKKIY